MSKKLIYPSKFEDAKMNLPEAPNVEFSFVVKAPKGVCYGRLAFTEI
jgi:hypothetical protein